MRKTRRSTTVSSQRLAESAALPTALVLFLGLSGCGHRNESTHLEVSTPESRSRAACEKGDAEACNTLGAALDNAGKSAEARTVLEKNCKAGFAKSCSNLGVVYHTGRGGGIDQPRAEAMYRAGCDGGDLGGCSNLGIALKSKGDLAAAKVALTKACPFQPKGAPSDAHACHARAAIAATSSPPDFETATTAADLGCKQHDWDSCGMLASFYANGSGVPKEPKTAYSLAKNGCDAKNVVCCTMLGFLFAHGVGVDKDVPRGKKLLQDACTGGEPAACANLKEL